MTLAGIISPNYSTGHLWNIADSFWLSTGVAKIGPVQL